MTFRDLIAISFGNLRRMKLRTFLTTSGVLIAIAAFVSMLSFGAGNQEYIEGQFNKLGLFTTMQVYPKGARNNPDSAGAAQLDAAAIDRIAAIPGVNLVYPFDVFQVIVKLGDTVTASRAQALPSAAMKTKLFAEMKAGTAFDSNSAHQAIISEDLAKQAGFAAPAAAIGQKLVVSVRVSTPDSGLAYVMAGGTQPLMQRFMKFRFDSLSNTGYRSRVMRAEANEALKRFLYGYMNAQATVSDTLTVCGVRPTGRGVRLRIEPVIVPMATASRFTAAGNSANPADILSAMKSGTLLAGGGDASGRAFPEVTVDFDPKAYYKPIKDSVEALGFRTFSFAAEFEQIQRAFLYFDLALGVIGLIALVTASLGIVNTMVMSITERRKEIGILKSLGADEPDIRTLFLVESGAIGLLGTVGGILFGWIITRVVSAIAQGYMRSQGVPEMDLFSLPLWLIFIALGVGVGVSVVAGFYPAARAARVDPVEALRNE